MQCIVTLLGATLILYIVNVPSFIFDQSSILTQEFEVLTAPIDMLVIREQLAKFLVEQVIKKNGEFHHHHFCVCLLLSLWGPSDV
jgi:hypothetical protein